MNIEQLVDQFANDMLDKLERVATKKSNSWRDDDWEEHWRDRMHYHFRESNFIDLANYSAFGRYHGWKL